MLIKQQLFRSLLHLIGRSLSVKEEACTVLPWSTCQLKLLVGDLAPVQSSASGTLTLVKQSGWGPLYI